jgi:tRNA(Leu) C34 or U34 (ribose-2'-O)-methylase TrmL
MVRRGFFAIGLDDPKTPANVGGILRAAGCYGAAFVAVGGSRMERLCRTRTDTQKAWKHMPLFSFVSDLRTMLPEGAVPVCIELTDDAESLVNFRHPERALYIFGPEDGSVRPELSAWCRTRVMIPTRFCMNLAACVNVVLYDRLSKSNAGAVPRRNDVGTSPLLAVSESEDK